MDPDRQVTTESRNGCIDIFEVRGRHHGHDLDDWLQAESELNRTHTGAIESLIVPIELRTQQAVRALQRLPFSTFAANSERIVKNCDHVPPSTLFLFPDRNFPLILPTHYNCNHDRHLEDQTIGQLVGILHEQARDPEHLRMESIAGIAADGQLFVAAGGFDLRAIIRRWVLGFHAALYREFLNAGQAFMTFPPLAEGNRDNLEIQRVPEIIPEVVRAIRFNRSLGKVDRLITRNGKCVYECVWMESDAPGTWFCAYALDSVWVGPLEATRSIWSPVASEGHARGKESVADHRRWSRFGRRHRQGRAGRRPRRRRYWPRCYKVAAAVGEHDNLLAIKLDVTRPQDAQAAVEASVAKFGRIDILVNKSAFWEFLCRLFEELTPDTGTRNQLSRRSCSVRERHSRPSTTSMRKQRSPACHHLLRPPGSSAKCSP